jgi:hypothetical protein
MMMDIDQAAKAMREEEMLAEIENFLEGFNQPTSAVCGSTASGSLPGQPISDGPGIRGLMQSGSSNRRFLHTHPLSALCKLAARSRTL